MPQPKTLMKIAGGLLLLALILIIALWILSPSAPLSPNNDSVSDESQQEAEQGKEELGRIDASSTVDSDIEAYLKSSNSVPNPNDLNDSYEDLNQ